MKDKESLIPCMLALVLCGLMLLAYYVGLKSDEMAHKESYSKGIIREYQDLISTEDLLKMIDEKCSMDDDYHVNCGENLHIGFKDEVFGSPGFFNYLGVTRNYQVSIKNKTLVLVASQGCNYPSIDLPCVLGERIEKVFTRATEEAKKKHRNRSRMEVASALYALRLMPSIMIMYTNRKPANDSINQAFKHKQ